MRRCIKMQGGSFYSSLPCAQEGVDEQLLCDGRGQCGLIVFAQLDALRMVLRQCRIAGLDCQGKAQIAQGVFMAAAHLRVAGQGNQFVERGEHLRRRAFKKAATAT